MKVVNVNCSLGLSTSILNRCNTHLTSPFDLFPGSCQQSLFQPQGLNYTSVPSICKDNKRFSIKLDPQQVDYFQCQISMHIAKQHSGNVLIICAYLRCFPSSAKLLNGGHGLTLGDGIDLFLADFVKYIFVGFIIGDVGN